MDVNYKIRITYFIPWSTAFFYDLSTSQWKARPPNLPTPAAPGGLFHSWAQPVKPQMS